MYTRIQVINTVIQAIDPKKINIDLLFQDVDDLWDNTSYHDCFKTLVSELLYRALIQGKYSLPFRQDSLTQ